VNVEVTTDYDLCKLQKDTANEFIKVREESFSQRTWPVHTTTADVITHVISELG
jgi:hypothetical protein